MARRRIVGISFDHMHMGDLLREAAGLDGAEIAGIYDPDRARMQGAIDALAIPEERVFTDLEQCLDVARPDLSIVCCATAEHARMVERIAPRGFAVLVEKPFAAHVADARAMLAAMREGGGAFAVNWPLAWVKSHNMAKRLIDAGEIGEVIEVHHYGGNRGPLYHLADKIEVSREEVERQKPGSWWYKRAAGGGSLLDYLGYGTTLGTWYRDGAAPLEIACMVDEVPGIEVDQHSITLARYANGLSKFETRWGTFTDPWTEQPQPKCGFVIAGTEGTISSYDYDDHVTVQTRARPARHRVAAEPLPPGRQGPVGYMLGCLARGEAPSGLLDPAVALTGQRMIDTAAAAAQAKRTLPLVD